MIRRLAYENAGATLVEFALLAPVLLMALMGIFDLAYNTYAKIMLEGAIQDAARASTIEGADTHSKEIDEAVERAVKRITPNATLAFERKAYSNFSDVAKPEDFTDINGNGTCDEGEPFEDINGNSSWDKDRGIDGLGGARDAVLYTVTVTFPRAFPVANLIGLPDTFSTEAVTVLRNQPYGMQDDRKLVQNCA